MNNRYSTLLSLALVSACTATPETPGDKPLPPAVGAVRSVGTYLPAPPQALLTSTKSGLVLVGTQGVPVDPRFFDRPSTEGSPAGWIRGGLIVLDSLTGKAIVYDETNGFPTARYADQFEDWGRSAAPVFSLAWVEEDERFVAAGWEFLIAGTRQADGVWKFSTTPLRATGEARDAKVSQVAVAGGELFVGSDQGTVVLDPTTLAVKRWLVLSTPDHGVYQLSGAGRTVAMLLGSADGRGATNVAVATADEAETVPVSLPEGTKPTTLLLLPAGIVVGLVDGDGRGSLVRVKSNGRALATVPLVDAKALGESSWGPFIPALLAADVAAKRLYVGGRIDGGGLVRVTLDDAGWPTGGARDVVPAVDRIREMLPWQVDLLTVEAGGRIWIGGRQRCDERRARQMGLYRLELGGEAPRLVRPIVSGVQAIAVQPDDHATWLGLRDENPGISCEGAVVQQAPCRLRADGSCEVFTPRLTDTESTMSPSPAPKAIAFGDPAKRELAIATTRDATWLRKGDSAKGVSTQIFPKISLFQTSAAWGEGGALWLGSRSVWDEMPGFDPVVVNARGPLGLGLLEVDDAAQVTFGRRYVRTLSDQDAGNVAGLPSNTVWDVLPIAGRRAALVACGVERKDSVYDHIPGAPAPSNATGGLAIVEDTAVQVLAAPTGVTFGDVVAIAPGPTGRAWALDATAGVFEVDLTTRTVKRVFAATWTAPERGLSFSAGDDGLFAIGTTKGLRFVRAGAETVAIADGVDGWVRSVRVLAKGVVAAGTDRGVRFFAVDGATLPASGPAAFASHEPWPLAGACEGAQGCACSERARCQKDLSCECEASGACACAAVDACEAAPGASGCACVAEASACDDGLECACEGEACACRAPAEPGCELHCTCDTATGCPEGATCHGGIAGNTCL